MTSAALRALRAEFPALDDGRCFLDWAATGLIPESTRLAVRAFVDRLATCPDGVAVWPFAAHGDLPTGTRTTARARLAGLLGAAPDDVAIVESTTAGLQIAAEAIRTGEGDNVVLCDLDYLAVGLPWTMCARARKLELRFAKAKDGAPDVASILERLDERTRAVVVSTIGWTTGALTDTAALAAECEARGIWLVLDAVQTFGVVPLDVRATPAAFIACGGHKWLCSPLGAGFLYASPRAAARARPQRFGFLAGKPEGFRDWGAWFRAGVGGAADEVVFPARGATFETGGTPSWPGAIGLDAATRLLAEPAPGEVLAHVRGLGTRLIEGLDRLGVTVVTPREPERRAGVVVFAAPGGREQELAWVEGLRARGVSVSARWSRGVGGVRAAFHGMNVAGEVDRLTEAVGEVLRAAS